MLQGLVPRGRISEAGIAFEPRYLRPFQWRDFSDGDYNVGPSPNAFPVSQRTFPFQYDADGRLRQEVFKPFQQRNLDSLFISIPFVGNDPVWAEKAAVYSGARFLPVVQPPDLYTMDRVHLNRQSKQAYTRAIVDALLLPSTGLAGELATLRAGNRVAVRPIVPGAPLAPGGNAPVAIPGTLLVRAIHPSVPDNGPAGSIQLLAVSGADKGGFYETTAPYPHTFDLEIEPDETRVAGSYALATGNEGANGSDSTNRMPRGWNFYGSKDGRNWQKLDSQHNVPEWKPNEQRRFPISAPFSYRRFRLELTEGANILRLYRIRIYPK
jgi:hypothetical protein